jgi:SAM-dependent methyltransferase
VENDQARFFDERVAESYDELAQRHDTRAAVAFLERLAAGGPALELGIGTGRVAFPLAARGIRVDGIDISPAMLARLRAKPGGEQVSVTIGDFAEVPVPGTYRLVFVVANTLCNLGTQDKQVRCFENVASHLTEEGSFTVEAFVPHPDWLRDGQYVEAEGVGIDEVRLDVCRIDVVAQRLEESHVVLSEDGVRLSPVVTRYIWPSELDLMARLAGLRLKERWAGWNREPFTSASRTYVCVYGP